MLLAAVAIASRTYWHEYIAASSETRNTRDATLELDRLLTTIRQAETSQRGFLLTSDSQYLTEYQRATVSARSRIARLKNSDRFTSVANDPLTETLWATIEEKLNELQATIDFASKGQVALAVALLRTNRGKTSMDQIQEIAGKIDAQLDQRLQEARSKSRQYVRWAELTATGGSAGIFVIVLLSSLQLRRLLSTRAQLTKKLARSAREFRVLADSVPQMVWRTGEEGELNYVNEEWIRFSGLGREGDPVAWQKLIHAQDRDQIHRHWQEARELKTPFALECRIKERLGGKYHWFLLQARPAPEGSESRLQWFVTFTDIEEQKQTQRLLMRANDELHQFAFVAAHDLQEPLRNIHLALDLLAREQPCKADSIADSEMAESLIRESMDNARRMHTMVKDLLAYSIALAKQQTVQASTDSEVCLMMALANLDAATKEAQARIHWSSLPQVRVEQTHLVQLFQNLIANSLKYRRPGVATEIEISGKRQGEDWSFSVVDNGIGFEPEHASKLFRVFKRLHRDQYEGTGIGLAICARIVAHYGGRIWAEGKPQEGAAFTFTLPDPEG